MNDPLLGALRAAVAAQLILWHTQAELAEALGYEDAPDDIDRLIRNEVSGLASCAPTDHLDTSYIGLGHAQALKADIEKARAK